MPLYSNQQTPQQQRTGTYVPQYQYNPTPSSSVRQGTPMSGGGQSGTGGGIGSLASKANQGYKAYKYLGGGSSTLPAAGASGLPQGGFAAATGIPSATTTALPAVGASGIPAGGFASATGIPAAGGAASSGGIGGSLGSAGGPLAAAAAGYVAGGHIGSWTEQWGGGSEEGGQIGGAAGATLGMMVGGPIGAVVGGLIGGVVGGMLGDLNYPFARVSTTGNKVTIEDALDKGKLEPLKQATEVTRNNLAYISELYGINQDGLVTNALGVSSNRKGSNLGKGFFTTVIDNGGFASQPQNVRSFGDDFEAAGADVIVRTLQNSDLTGADQDFVNRLQGYSVEKGMTIENVFNDLGIPGQDAESNVPKVAARRATAQTESFRDFYKKYKQEQKPITV